MTDDDKTKLFKDWMKFKKAENKAKAERVKIENSLDEIYGKIEGKSQTIKEVDLGFSINVKKNTKISLDQDAWIEARKNVPVDLRPEKVVFGLDTKGFDYLKEHNQDIYKIVSDCVTIKDNKSTIKVEKI